MLLDVYQHVLVFQNYIWNFIKLFYTALMKASQNGYIEIVQVLLGLQGLEFNAVDIYFINLMFISH